jgi:hypothetical protein
MLLTVTDETELVYHALCIDTNVFYETGYAFEKGLSARLEQLATSPVEVVLSEIVDREMKRHLIEHALDHRYIPESGRRTMTASLVFECPCDRVSGKRTACS